MNVSTVESTTAFSIPVFFAISFTISAFDTISDIIKVKKWFQSDLVTYNKISEIANKKVGVFTSDSGEISYYLKTGYIFTDKICFFRIFAHKKY